MTDVYTGKQIFIYTWLSRKYAARLESKGLRHSSGRSVRALCKKELGLKRNATQEEIEIAIHRRIDEILNGEREGL